MYLYEDIVPAGGLQGAQEQITTELMIMTISVYSVIAAVTTALACCVLGWIAKNEKREDNLRAVWNDRKNKTEHKMITIPLLIAIVVSLLFMGLDIILK